MAFTPTTNNDSRPATAALVAQAALVTSLSADSVNNRAGTNNVGVTKTQTPGVIQQGDVDGRLYQSQIEEVTQALNLGKLQPATVISTLSINVNLDPILGGQITQLTSLIANNPLMNTSGALSSQLAACQEQAILNAVAKGSTSAANILAMMSGGN